MRYGIAFCSWIFLSLIQSLDVYADSCALQHLEINPIAHDRKDTFVGKGRTLDIQFSNESKKEPIKVFPEPPIKVFHHQSGLHCEIDGGVWLRDGVFLSNNEALLVVLEFSGASNHLKFYSTENCSQRSDLDVSGARWKIESNKITIGRLCSDRRIESCKKRRLVDVNKLCPILSKE